MVARSSIRCLIIPGLECSGPDHWQTLWETRRSDCVRVEMQCWDDPTRDTWIAALDEAVAEIDAAILVAHSLGCLAVAWWTAMAAPALLGKVRGAMLVAPPDVDRPDADPRLRRFAPTPSIGLPFRSILIASRNDAYAGMDHSVAMASRWRATLIDVGRRGHINADSGLDDWPDGQGMLAELIDASLSPVDTPAVSRPTAL